MKMSRSSFACAAALAAGMVWASPAAAAFTQNYGDCAGTTVMWQQVTESNAGASALFGAPSCSGTTIDFDPTGFVAEEDPGPGIDSIDGQLNFTMMALGSSFINEVRFDEAGDYTLLHIPIAGASTSFVRAELSVRLEITMLDDGSNVLIDHPGGGGADVTSVTLVLPVDWDTLGNWSLSAVFDVNQILADNSVFGKKATKIDVVLDNTLTAIAENGDTARIIKKDFKGLTVTAVPEPLSGLLLLMGVSALAAAGRRS
jgi:hypothetical protein